VQTVTRTDEFIFSATAGGSWSHSFDDNDSSILVIGQYLFSGEGYSDPAILRDNQAGISALIAGGDLGFSDLQSTGRHYTAATVRWSDMFGSGVGSGVFWMQNYSDMSARIVPSVSTALFDAVDLSFQVPITLGQTGEDLSPLGNTLSASLSLSLGSGTF